MDSSTHDAIYNLQTQDSTTKLLQNAVIRGTQTVAVIIHIDKHILSVEKV